MWDPAKLAAAWSAGMAGAGAAWMNGINQLTESPMAKAAAPDAMSAYAAGCAASITNGRRARGLAKMDLGGYKNRCNLKQSNLGVGARAAAPQMAGVFTNLIPIWQSMKSAAHAVGGPRGVNSVAKFQAAFQALMSGVGKQVK
jgi:hypothetical protein